MRIIVSPLPCFFASLPPCFCGPCTLSRTMPACYEAYLCLGVERKTETGRGMEPKIKSRARSTLGSTASFSASPGGNRADFPFFPAALPPCFTSESSAQRRLAGARITNHESRITALSARGPQNASRFGVVTRNSHSSKNASKLLKTQTSTWSYPERPGASKFSPLLRHSAPKIALISAREAL